MTIQQFLNAELAAPLADAHQPIPRLKIGAVFPPEILAVIQKDTSAAFLQVWHSAERAIERNIRKTTSERGEYGQICKRLSQWKQRFSWELSQFPEITNELEHRRPEGYISIPQDSASFSQLVTRIENNLKDIEDDRTKPSGLMDRFFREQKKQRTLKLFIETRELLIAAHKGQNSIPRQIDKSTLTFSANIAQSLFQSLQQWLSKQQEKVGDDCKTTSREKDRLEVERQQIQRRRVQEEAQLAEAKETFDASARGLTNTFQELSTFAHIPEALRKIAQQNANFTTSALSFVEDYQIACRNWVGDIQRLEMLVNKLWGELEAADRKFQQRLAQIQRELEQQRRKLSERKSEQETLEASLQHSQSDLLAERQWWSGFWQTIPEYLCPLEPPEGIFAFPLLEAVEKQFKAWASELAREEYLAQRYDRLIC